MIDMAALCLSPSASSICGIVRIWHWRFIRCTACLPDDRWDVSEIDGHNHLWPGYFQSTEIMSAIAPVLYYPGTAQFVAGPAASEPVYAPTQPTSTPIESPANPVPTPLLPEPQNSPTAPLLVP